MGRIRELWNRFRNQSRQVRSPLPGGSRAPTRGRDYARPPVQRKQKNTTLLALKFRCPVCRNRYLAGYVDALTYSAHKRAHEELMTKAMSTHVAECKNTRRHHWRFATR